MRRHPAFQSVGLSSGRKLRAHLTLSVLPQPAFGQRHQGKKNFPIVFTMTMEIHQVEDGEGGLRSDDTCTNKE
jgi:hypothetical protein